MMVFLQGNDQYKIIGCDSRLVALRMVVVVDRVRGGATAGAIRYNIVRLLTAQEERVL